MNPASVGSVTVTFNATAAASNGTPNWPATGTTVTESRCRGPSPRRVSSSRAGDVATNEGRGPTGASAKFAVTDRSASIVRVHAVDIPAQEPVHPANVEPG